jgi:hypothetical protein
MAQEPVELVQGTSVAWSRDFGDYPPSDAYVLTYEFRGEGSALTVTGVAGASAWDVAITASESAALTAGEYVWQVFASKTGERHFLDSGSLVIVADLATNPAPTDKRTHAAKMLELLSTMLENNAYLKTQTPESIAALVSARKGYEWDVKRELDAEKLKRGGYPTRKVFARFITPGV